MKKLIRNVIATTVAIIVMLININVTFAADNDKVKMSLGPTSIEKGKNFSVYVSQNVSGGILGITGELEFDENILTLKAIKDFEVEGSDEAWTDVLCDVDTKNLAVISADSKMKTQENVVELIFEWKASAEFQETEIKIEDTNYLIEGASVEEDDIEVPIGEVILKINPANVSAGNNTAGNNTAGNNTTENNTTGNNTTGNNTTGNNTTGNNTTGNNTTGNNTAGNNTAGNNTTGNNSNNTNTNNTAVTNASTLPKTGSSGSKIVILGVVTIIFGTVMYLQYRKYKGI